MVLDLDKWNQDMGGDVADTMFADRKSGFEWKLERGYYVKVTRASIVESQRGDTQLRLALDIFPDAEAQTKLGDCLEHLTLPRQDSDRNFPKQKAATMNQRRMQDIQKVLISAQPALYGIYETRAEVPGSGGKHRYIGFDGKVLTGDSYEARRKEVNRAADLVTIEWHGKVGEEIEELADTGFYVVRRANPKSDKYLYLNIYTEKPRAVPMVGDDGEGDDDAQHDLTPF